ncbi:TRAP transporter substrate-binding protein [Pseudorhodoferax sp. Leaf274]|uniref:TRAP transporter substrate-binding protein n=1 Tax=Pseudorhodoferax sp. Leaf274 TaxID=1736318 RepID=UPI0007037A9B|nr:TRAP transporter substrate-binding protein [Pseudorhodoferax sp. Leaf274]KQP49910.1 ABC transporter substrate-binding protein [Pseudorhodoferax sp. Leaf274]
MKRLMLKTLVAAAAIAAFGAAQAQDTRTIKFATQNPKGHPLVMGMEKFAEIVAAKSGGKLKVNLFPGGTLGSDQANVSAIQGGTLEMATMNSGILASQVKEFAVYDFPFMFGSNAEAEAIVDGPFGKKLHDKLKDKGLIGLSYFELGFRDITNSKRPITKVEDLAGLKLRVIPNPINVDWVKALDANPTPLPFPEVYAALEQKAIDGQENPVTVINANKFYEVQKHVVLSHHQYNPQSVLISKKFWDSLQPAQQKIVADAAVEATKYQRQQAREQVAIALDNMKKNGMQVTELPPAELTKLRDRMRPVTAKHAVTVGQDVVAELQAELAKVRK